MPPKFVAFHIRWMLVKQCMTYYSLGRKRSRRFWVSWLEFTWTLHQMYALHTRSPQQALLWSACCSPPHYFEHGPRYSSCLFETSANSASNIDPNKPIFLFDGWEWYPTTAHFSICSDGSVNTPAIGSSKALITILWEFHQFSPVL